MPGEQSSKSLPKISGFTVLPVTMPPLTLIQGASLYDHLTESSLSNKKSSHLKSEPIVHHLFIKPHQSLKSKKKALQENVEVEPQEEELLPAGRTLFVLNLPVDTTLSHLKRLFRRCGVIENVVLKGKKALIPGSVHKSGTTCHVIFEDPESIDRAMNMKPRQRVWSAAIEKEESDDLMDEDAEDSSELDSLIGMNSKATLLYVHSC